MQHQSSDPGYVYKRTKEEIAKWRRLHLAVRDSRPQLEMQAPKERQHAAGKLRARTPSLAWRVARPPLQQNLPDMWNGEDIYGASEEFGSQPGLWARS